MTFTRLSTVAALLTSVVAQYYSPLPIVDLGYELHQASAFNVTGGYYNFSNIRYAAPPIGNLRFAQPQSPAVNRSVVQTGHVSTICPQANPTWINFAGTWIGNYLTGKPINITQAQVDAANNSVTAATVPKQDPRATEDCLFLDVMVPKGVFDNAGKGYGAEVLGSFGCAVLVALVWRQFSRSALISKKVYGGGYTLGSKTGSGDPAGLVMRSKAAGRQGVIYVAMNYRLGAFGWLSGPTFSTTGGTPNAGLYDQRFALQWVQEHIASFGGDPNRVTVFGESAGGGSIMHQITAFGGTQGRVPFNQAVPQSPGWQPITSNFQQETMLDDFLLLAGVKSIEEARLLPSDKLITANSIQVAKSRFGGFTYGPVVDGIFAPELPGVLLAQGRFDKSLRIMVGHNGDEGLLFVDPLIVTEADTQSFLRQVLVDADPSVLNYITTVLYPPVFDGSHGYTDQISRSALLTSELIFTCNTYYLDRAYKFTDYSYFFTVPPALHGQDIAYTYYNGGGVNAATSLTNVTVAIALQDYITTFAELGRPESPDVKGIPMFAQYGPNAQVQDLGQNAITRVTDPSANFRCLWWQLALYN